MDNPKISFRTTLKTTIGIAALAGLVLSSIEAFLLVFQLSPQLVSGRVILLALLIYTILGALLGAFASLPLSFIFRRSPGWTTNKRNAFSFALFLSLGLYLVMVLYLMDIYPYGGPNRGSTKTKVLLLLGALLCLVFFLILFGALKLILGNQRHRRLLLAAVIILILAGAAVFFTLSSASRPVARTASNPQSRPKPPINVIMVLVDALRPDHLSCNGYFRPTSPHIDRLAREGFQFSRTYAASTWSIPTHASLFTGLYTTSHQTYSGFNAMAEEIPTLAEILTNRGYNTLALSDNQLLCATPEIFSGFQRWITVESDTKTTFALFRLYEKLIVRRVGMTRRMLAMSQTWITHSQRSGQPFFLFMNLFDVHAWHHPREPYFGRFSDLSLEETDHPDLIRRLSVAGFSQTGKDRISPLLTERDLSYLRARYDSTVRFTDERLRDFMHALDRKGLLQNTLVIITSDHGEFLGEHGVIGHVVDDLYEPVLRIPLIFWCPEHLKPGTSTIPVSQVDIAPTILKFVGFEKDTPVHAQGRDIFSITESSPVLVEYFRTVKPGQHRALIGDTFKYILFLDGSNELYNLRDDPGETQNLAGRSPQVVAQMAALLEDILAPFHRFKSKTNEALLEEKRRLMKTLGYLNHP